MAGISLAEATKLAFDTILDKINHSGLHGKSPTFFVIYAHDNNKEPRDLLAHQNTVKSFISWFQKVLFNVVSDKSPHGYGPILGPGRDGASNNIITNQLCLLPKKWNELNVDYVLVFYSKLLAQYMKYEREYRPEVDGQPTQTYFEAIFQACTEHDYQGTDDDQKAWEDRIRSLQDTYSIAMGTKFHHVLTELALLRFRNKGQVRCYTIPILLGEDVENWEPDYQWRARYLEMAETEIRVPVSPGNPYRSFFKILSRFETLESDWPLIDNFLACFEKSVAAHKRGMTATDFQTHLAGNIFEVYRSLHEGQVYHLKRPMLVGSIRDILDVYVRNSAILKRVSGDDLPSLDDIELEIPQEAEPLKELFDQKAKQENEGDYEQKPTPEKVLLRDLFSKRKVGDKDIQPYRVFIRGKPGVGKSTLCRRIMYEYSLHDELRAKFELLVFIPARKLDLELADILYSEYFRTIENGRSIADFLSDHILRSVKVDESPSIPGSEKVAKSPSILVLLDGLDEARGWEPPKREVLDRLLKLPAVLVTSRVTDDAGSVPFDLRVDAVGLSMDSVKAFLGNQNIVSPSNAEAIERLISVNAAVREIVRVPIYLDIICSGWDEGNDADHKQQPTMTALYQGVMHSLWRKDIPRLHKIDQGELVTHETIQAVKDTGRLERVVEVEVVILEQLAITMMVWNQLDFTEHDIAGAIRDMEKVYGPLPLSLEKNLATLSVLRSSPGRYSFVHPTFQEFFAARYIARDLNHIEKFMKSHKYHPRFDMVWRVVAGLLSDSEHLEFFFAILGQEPLDLLGPTHQRMVMRCLNEIHPKTELSIRANLESSLRMWVLFECRITEHSHIVAEAEFPMSSLHTLLTSTHHNTVYRTNPREILIQSLSHSKAHFSKEVVEALLQHVKNDSEDAACAFQSQANLPDNVVLGLVEKLKLAHGYRRVSFAAAKTIAHQASWSAETAAAIVRQLKDNDRDTEAIICGYAYFPVAIVMAAIDAVANIEENGEMVGRFEELVGTNFFDSTWIRPNLPKQAIFALLDISGCGRAVAEGVARFALRLQENLPYETVLDLLPWLHHRNLRVMKNAAFVLSRQKWDPNWKIPDQTATAAINLLEDKAPEIHSLATAALQPLATNLEDTALVHLARLLEKDKADPGHVAVVLEKSTNLPNEAVSVLVKAIESGKGADHCAEVAENLIKRVDCARVLGMQEHLSGELAIPALMGLLDDKNGDVRAAAIGALIRHQKSLQESLQGPVSSAIDDLLREYATSNPGVLGLSMIPVLEALQLKTATDTTISALIDTLKTDYNDLIHSRIAKVLENQNLQGPHRAALAQVLRRDDDRLLSSRFKFPKSQLFACRSGFMEKLPEDIGLKSETAGEAPSRGEPEPTVCEIETIDAWYGVWLCLSFKERLVLYVEHDAGRLPRLCLSQPSGLRSARFKDWDDYKRFLAAIEKGRKRWVAPDVVKTMEESENGFLSFMKRSK